MYNALVPVVLHECGLHWMQVVRHAQSLDGRNPVTLVHHGEAQAGVDPPALDYHGARAALAVIAPLLRAGEMQFFAQRIQQRGSNVHLEFPHLTVDSDGHFCSLRCLRHLRLSLRSSSNSSAGRSGGGASQKTAP
jgi:hypothetical protein